MALITAVKDDQVKHRLIVDCRVSGANSCTTKWERILLPRIGDVLKDSMKLKSGAGQGSQLYY